MWLKLIISIVLIMNFGLLFGQQLDSSLINHQGEMVKFLKRSSGLIELSKKDSACFTLLYSRKIVSFCDKQISYFEIGIIGTHSKKYLSVLTDEKLLFFETKNFDSEFYSIINEIKNCSKYITAKTIVDALVDIKGIYDYNNNPPWHKNTFKKNK